MIRSIGKVFPKNSLLFVCDIQSKFANHIHKFNDVVNQSKCMIKVCKELDIKTIFTEQYPQGLGKTVEELTNINKDNSKVFPKTQYSMLTEDVLKCLKSEEYKDVKSIIIVGIEAHVCVLHSTLDFLDQNYDVHIVADAVSSSNTFDRQIALDRMKQSGAYITSVESMIFQLAKDSTHPSFKNLMFLNKARKDELKGSTPFSL